MGAYDATERWYIAILKTKQGSYIGFKFVQVINEIEARYKAHRNESGRTLDYIIDSLIDVGENVPYVCR